MRGPLDGVRVLAFTQFAAGPFAALQLADLGAEVIKLESARGDVGRTVPPGLGDGDSLYFQALNRGVLSVRLDMAGRDGQEIVRRLAGEADAFLANARPSLLRRLGLSAEALQAVNPRLVHCTLSAYGQHGPRAEAPGYDPLIQAQTGLVATTGEPGGPPGKTMVSFVDFAAGFAVAFALASGVLEARQRGVGRAMDVSLNRTAVSMLSYLVPWTLDAGFEAERLPGSAHASVVPAQLLPTADGWLMVACFKEAFWHAFAIGIGRDDLLADDRLADFAGRSRNRAALVEELTATLMTRTTQEWLAALDGVPVAPVLGLRDALLRSDLAEEGAIVEVEHPTFGTIHEAARPVEFAGPHPRRRAPALGEHTIEVLERVAGATPEDLDRWRSSETI